MFGSEIIDTAIGLVFVFLLISVLVTIVNEMIASVLLSRAKWLQFGISHLIGSDWARDLYAHPLIGGSTGAAWSEPSDSWSGTIRSRISAWFRKTPPASGAAGDAQKIRRNNRGSGPSYMTSRAFSDVLIHLVVEKDDVLEQIRGAIRRETQHALNPPRAVATPATQTSAVLAPADAPSDPGATPLLPVAAPLNPSEAPLLPDGAPLDSSEAPLLPITAPSDPVAAPSAQIDALLASIRKSIGDKSSDFPKVANDIALAVASGRKKNAAYGLTEAVADIDRFVDRMPLRYLSNVIDRLDGNDRIQKTLRLLMNEAEHDVERFKQNIEIWFNNAMQRVSGWYKRRSQFVLFGLGLLAAVGMNIDPLAVGSYLQTHKAVRDAIVAKADTFAKAALPKNDAEKAPTRNDATAPATKTNATAPDAPPATKTDASTRSSSVAAPAAMTADARFDQAEQRFAQTTALLTSLDLPIGWLCTAPDVVRDTYHQRLGCSTLPSIGTLFDAAYWSEVKGKIVDASAWRKTVGYHLIGWLVTAFAATLGAPFWFDMLNRIMSIRAAGKPPEEKPRSPRTEPQPLGPGETPQEADRLAALGKK